MLHFTSYLWRYFMKYELLQNSFPKERKKEEYPFSIEERKWAAEAIADCYKRIENGTAKRLKARD